MGSPAVRVERVFDSEDTTDVCRIATDGARATLAWRTDASLKLSPASLRALAGMLVEAAGECEKDQPVKGVTKPIESPARAKVGDRVRITEGHEHHYRVDIIEFEVKAADDRGVSCVAQPLYPYCAKHGEYEVVQEEPARAL